MLPSKRKPKGASPPTKRTRVYPYICDYVEAPIVQKVDASAAKNHAVMVEIKCISDKLCCHEGCTYHAIKEDRCIFHVEGGSHVNWGPFLEMNEERKEPLLSDKFCSHKGCIYHAIKGDKCIFHVDQVNSGPFQEMSGERKEPLLHDASDDDETTITLPITSGRLGLTLEFSESYNGALITAIDPACAFKDHIDVDDRLLTIDGVMINKKEDLMGGKDRKVRMFGFVANKGDKEKRKTVPSPEGAGEYNKNERSTEVDRTVCTCFSMTGEFCGMHCKFPNPREFPTPVKDRDKCSTEGCNNKAIQGGICFKHGGKRYRKRCTHDGCTNQVINKGVCHRHGAKKHKQCSHEGCNNYVVNGGVCVKHGAQKKECSHEGCTNISQRGGVCKKHGGNKPRCSHEGCTNLVRNRGVCIRHGADVPLCSHEGCTNKVINGGVCVKHGAKVKRKCKGAPIMMKAGCVGGTEQNSWAK